MHTEGQDTHSHARALRARGQRIKRSDRRTLKRAFLRLYPRLETVGATCAQLGIARNTFYGWLQRDAQFSSSYYGYINGRFEAQMQALDAKYGSEDYWLHQSEGDLMRAAKRLMSRAEKEDYKRW